MAGERRGQVRLLVQVDNEGPILLPEVPCAMRDDIGFPDPALLVHDD